MDIKDKVGLITGGAYGIGKKLTETLLQKGAKVSRTHDLSATQGSQTVPHLTSALQARPIPVPMHCV